MQTLEGVVEHISQKEVNTKFGPKTAFSLKVGEDWISGGFKRPDVQKGQTVRVVYTTNGNYKNLDSVEVVDSAPKVATGTTPTSSGGTDWDAKDKRIALMSCRNSALQLAEIAIAAGATPFLPTKKDDKYEALEAFVDKKAQEYFEQLYTEGFNFEQNLQDNTNYNVEEVEE